MGDLSFMRPVQMCAVWSAPDSPDGGCSMRSRSLRHRHGSETAAELDDLLSLIDESSKYCVVLGLHGQS